MNKFARQRFLCILLTVILSLLTCWSGQASAADVNLAWNACTWQGVAGYKVYYGTGSRAYKTSLDVLNVTSYAVTGLTDGTYYFAVTAYDTSGVETGYSNEISITVGTPGTGRLPAPVNVNVRKEDAAAFLKIKR